MPDNTINWEQVAFSEAFKNHYLTQGKRTTECFSKRYRTFRWPNIFPSAKGSKR